MPYKKAQPSLIWLGTKPRAIWPRPFQSFLFKLSLIKSHRDSNIRKHSDGLAFRPLLSMHSFHPLLLSSSKSHLPNPHHTMTFLYPGTISTLNPSNKNHTKQMSLDSLSPISIPLRLFSSSNLLLPAVVSYHLVLWFINAKKRSLSLLFRAYFLKRGLLMNSLLPCFLRCFEKGTLEIWLISRYWALFRLQHSKGG